MAPRVCQPCKPPFAVGVKVQYHGHRMGAGPDADHIMYLDDGDIGVCTSTRPGWQGTGRALPCEEGDDGEVYYDETHDGWSVVKFPSGIERAVRRDSVVEGRYLRVK